MAKRRPAPEGALMRRTRELLADCKTDRLQIYSDTGIAPNWLWAFQAGKIPDPSVNRVEQLYSYLTGFPLVTR